MTSTATLYGNPEKTTISFITFRIGDAASPTYVRVCDAKQSMVFRGSLFLGEPNMELRLAKDTLGLREDSTQIVLPYGTNRHPSLETFLTDISSGLPYPPVKIIIEEMLIPMMPGQTTRNICLFKGALDLAIRYPEDEDSDVVRIETKNAKANLDGISLGIIIDSGCPFIYGGEGCLKDLLPHILTDCYMSVFPGPSFTVQIFGASAGTTLAIRNQSPGWWNQGYFELRGLRAQILSWAHLTNSFTLMQPPPANFDGSPISNIGRLVPGCNGSISDCRIRSNEIHFGGIGAGIPDYNPTYEVASG